ncbi:hypothetical protein WICMUC_003855 [Wickerhamomyces mucosus]|uniref:Histone transcription regulator 3 homolog n=1 Tax=Wickerhamomyces mucosus TaxID=1378264 RepID=A0A9P8TBM9_9ASCO|nr:hypothetical protein WICMUC_003855 [Wickerhamomyces mucosus]
MSSFAAVNLTAEDIAFDAEEHTRELQIEEAFKIYQTALKLQKDFKFKEANALYKELFKIDVITNIDLKSPTIKTLKYLAFRNRGLLKFDELKSSINILNPEESYNLLSKTIEDLIISIQYNDGDTIIINLLLAIFQKFNNLKLSRYIIEYELTKDESNEYFIHSLIQNQSPEYLIFKNYQREVLTQIHEYEQQFDQFQNQLKIKLPDLSFLTPLKDYVIKRREDLENSWTKIISLDSITWKSIASNLMTVLQRNRLRIAKFKDTYNLKDFPIFQLKFKIPQDDDLQFIESKIPNSSIEIDLDKEKFLANNQNHQIIDKISAKNESIEIEDGIDKISEIIKPLDSNKRSNSSDDQPQRSSKRLRAEQETNIQPIFEIPEIDGLILHINNYLQKIGKHIDSSLQIEISSNIDGNYSKDLYFCLQNWTLRLTDILFQPLNKKSEIDIDEIFASGGFDNENSNISSNLGDKFLLEFIEKVNSSSMHFHEVRLLFIETLFIRTDKGCLILDEVMDKELYSMVEIISFTLDNHFYNEAVESKELSSERASIYITFFEISINALIEMRAKLKNREIQLKHLSDFKTTQRMLEIIVLKWRKVLEGKVVNKIAKDLTFRYRWALLLLLQSEDGFDVIQFKTQLEEFYQDFQSYGSKITLVNYSSIPTITLSTIKNQNDKLNIISAFENALNSQKNTDATAQLLEFLLLYPDKPNPSPQEQSMSIFIIKSPLKLKLQLWKILLNIYVEKSELDKYVYALTKVLPILSSQITSDSYLRQSHSQRQITLITTISYYGEYLDGISNLLKSHHWELQTGNDKLLDELVSIMPIFVTYCLFERKNPPSTGSFRRTSKSYQKIREILVNLLSTFFVLYFKRLTVDDRLEITCDFVSIIHQEIGFLNFCDVASENFLKMAHHFLNMADSQSFEPDILQLMNCRYHISISGENFSPSDHKTLGAELNEDSSVQISLYLFDILKKKKNFLTALPKPDIKSGLDTLYKAVGSPDYENGPTQKNTFILKNYLETSYIDVSLSRDALLGELQLPFRHPYNDAMNNLVRKDLYFYQGVVNLSIYNSRRKLAQAKASDLEFIIEMFQNDLICGSNRVESWIFLGQTFALSAEDDLIWTSDKLNSQEKKLATASTQKKSLLCYFMALSVYLSSPTTIESTVFNPFISAFVRDIYQYLMKPMDGLCYLDKGEFSILTEKGLVVRSESKISDRKYNFILKVALKLAKLGVSLSPDDWTIHYYYAKILNKLGYAPLSVLNKSLKSCSIYHNGIEPHYQFCSFLYKFVRDGKIDQETGLKYILENVPSNSIFKDLKQENEYQDPFISYISSALKKLIYLDKKKWFHRPRFRLAKIRFDLGQYEASFEAIEPIIIVKNSNRNLVSIWKPETEPPGKHFSYNFEYIMFYLDLADRLCDLQSLIIFTKKLRRYGASMVNLYDAWDKGCTVTCGLIKDVIGAERGYSDIEVPKLVYSEFVDYSQKLLQRNLKSRIDNDDEIQLLVLLYEVTELRRMNNGFGPTSLVDDTLNSIYLKIYLEEVLGHPDLYPTTDPNSYTTNAYGLITNTPHGTPVSASTKLRVARKEISAAATLYAKTFESNIKDIKVSDDTTIEIPPFVHELHLKNLIREQERQSTPDLNNHLEQGGTPSTPIINYQSPQTPNRSFRYQVDTPSNIDPNGIMSDATITPSSNKNRTSPDARAETPTQPIPFKVSRSPQASNDKNNDTEVEDAEVFLTPLATTPKSNYE